MDTGCRQVNDTAFRCPFLSPPLNCFSFKGKMWVLWKVPHSADSLPSGPHPSSEYHQLDMFISFSDSPSSSFFFRMCSLLRIPPGDEALIDERKPFFGLVRFVLQMFLRRIVCVCVRVTSQIYLLDLYTEHNWTLWIEWENETICDGMSICLIISMIFIFLYLYLLWQYDNG